MSYWDDYEKASKDEGGGGGILCRARIETGYKAYVSGMNQEDTFFPAPADDREKRDVAKDKANGLGSRANWGIQIRAFRDGAFSAGSPATWQQDRFFNSDSWTSACSEVVVPSLKEAGVKALPFEGYVRIGFANDPFKEAQGEAGKTDTDQNGNARFPQVAYISAVLSEAEYKAAVAALDSATVASDGLPMPPQPWPTVMGEWEKEVRKLADGVDLSSVPAALNAITENMKGVNYGDGVDAGLIFSWAKHYAEDEVPI